MPPRRKPTPPRFPTPWGSAGGSDHILLGMIAKAVGVQPTKVSYVAFAGGGPATAALLGNQVAAGISGYGEFAEQVKAGKLRIIAVSSDKRQEGIAAPTLKEEGIDVELFNWRGVYSPLPASCNDAQRKAMIALMEKMTTMLQWAEACKMRVLDPDCPVRRRVQGLSGKSGDREDRTHPPRTRAGVTWPAGARRNIGSGGSFAAPARRNDHRRRRAGARDRHGLADAVDPGVADLRPGRPHHRADHHRERARHARCVLLLVDALQGGWQSEDEKEITPDRAASFGSSPG